MDADPDSWVDWLPFVLLAYRTHVHSKLMFGRKMNTFTNWVPTYDTPLDDELLQRAAEIKMLTEETHPTVSKLIQDGQVTQRKISDKRRNIKETVIPEKTTVYVMDKAIHPK